MLSGIVIARVPNTREQPFTHKLQIECVCEVKNANMTLGTINNKNTIARLYKSLVRLKLQYCIQAWTPLLVKDIELLEQVQHRATKLIFVIS